MDPLEHALHIANQMRDSFEAELAEAREQRVLVRTLDVQGLFERARRRGEFNVHVAGMQQELGETLAAVGAELGLPRVSIEGLGSLGLELAAQLALALSELRALTQALQEVDGLNLVLSRRALGCVRGYLSAVSVRGDTYDRYGSVRTGAVTSIARQVA